MMFRSGFLPGIRDGSVTRSYRYWKRPQVKVDGIYQLQGGDGVRVTRFERVNPDSISRTDAQAAGFDSPDDLTAYLSDYAKDRELYCVVFELVTNYRKSAPDRTPIQDADQLAVISEKLTRMDARNQTGAWTRETLQLILSYPGLSSSRLAQRLGQDQKRLKQNIRKLKHLGLTISLETGYRVSERGESLLSWLENRINEGV